MSEAMDLAFFAGIGLMGYAHDGVFYAGFMLFAGALAMAALSTTGDTE